MLIMDVSLRLELKPLVNECSALNYKAQMSCTANCAIVASMVAPPGLAPRQDGLEPSVLLYTTGQFSEILRFWSPMQDLNLRYSPPQTECHTRLGESEIISTRIYFVLSAPEGVRLNSKNPLHSVKNSRCS